MIFKPYYYFETGCAAYLFGCGGQGVCAVIDPHLDDVETYVKFAESKGMRISHVFDTHIHAVATDIPGAHFHRFHRLPGTHPVTAGRIAA